MKSLGWSASLCILLCTATASCRDAAGDVACPRGTARDDARAEAILRRLRAATHASRLPDEVARLLRAGSEADARAFCFGDTASELVERGPLVLDARIDDGALTARAGHLLLHRSAAVPWTADERGPCAERVARAVRAEAVALAAELELRRALGVSTAFPAETLEREFRDARPEEHVAVVERHLLAHPQGVAGVGASVAAYRERCRREGS